MRGEGGSHMGVVAGILVALVAAEHIYFLILEMFLWRTPRGRATFGTTQEYADASATLAANQGLYNGFLAAGLIWSLLSTPHGYALRVFFLCCVVVAGIYGGATVKPRIALIQALPAALGLAATFLAG